ncbi:3-hydroxyisobutyrate dehydrogenase [Tistlia consotensis]|uniref:3-hydroxyisobutyrate dehydrogenase n=1 Tax=Tistlia consotensis USBA 355 TaxID=560819 RepID=A0A1Y6CHE4_9PROT|nr:NAD(P)-dependent oxidoreductase [Tistlia consotensis]SMF65546.1 3-hydroxyisobutyrate dehydrogenase [Tistlia consotensis USBA 355]SNS03584.1 3-hydroxyisobutyrate dehydrogenase [Tistlia consotensis]
MPRDSTVGFVGLGAMGVPMAGCLLKGGQALLGYDVSETARERAAEAGVPLADSLEQVGRDCGLVVTMLPTAEIVREAALGAGGFAQALSKGDLVVDMSSSYPLATRRLGEELAERGLGLVDAPISGGVPRARTGSLAIMAGGPEAEVARAEPLLGHMGKVLRVGALGNGHAMKALNNYVSAAGLVAACEALIVGETFGLAPETIVEVLNVSTGRNNSTENKLKQFVLNRRFDAGFAFALMQKDVRAAADLSKELGLDEPLLKDVIALLDQAGASLPPGADHTRVFEWLERH